MCVLRYPTSASDIADSKWLRAKVLRGGGGGGGGVRLDIR